MYYKSPIRNYKLFEQNIGDPAGISNVAPIKVQTERPTIPTAKGPANDEWNCGGNPQCLSFWGNWAAENGIDFWEMWNDPYFDWGDLGFEWNGQGWYMEYDNGDIYLPLLQVQWGNPNAGQWNFQVTQA